MTLSPPQSSGLTEYADVFDASLGIVSRNFGLPVAPSSSNQTMSTQRLYGVLVPYRAGQVITNVGVVVAIAGAGTVPTTIKLGVGSPTTNKAVAVTANTASSGQWTAAGLGLRTFALTAAYTVPLDGPLWHYVLTDGIWGTTQPAILRGTTIGSGGAVNGAGQLEYGNVDGQTDIVVGTTYTLVSTAGVGLFAFST